MTYGMLAYDGIAYLTIKISVLFLVLILWLATTSSSATQKQK